MPTALTARDAVVRFGEVTALDGFSMTADVGAVTALLGPNGAGKTTFVRTCTGLVPLDAGDIEIVGTTPGSSRALTRVGLMPQSTGAWSGVRAKELVSYLAGLYANPLPVDELCRTLGIDEFASTPYRRLSGGQKQSVNLAGAIVGRPELVFLDEPTAGLDPHARHHTWELVGQLRDAGVAVVLTTHDMAEAEKLADRVYIVDHGRVIASGTVAELTADQSLEDLYLTITSDRMAR